MYIPHRSLTLPTIFSHRLLLNKTSAATFPLSMAHEGGYLVYCLPDGIGGNHAIAIATASLPFQPVPLSRLRIKIEYNLHGRSQHPEQHFVDSSDFLTDQLGMFSDVHTRANDNLTHLARRTFSYLKTFELQPSAFCFPQT